MSLVAARAAREEAAAVRRAGQDPIAHRREEAASVAAADAHTFEVVARAWHTLSRSKWRELHADDVLRSLERDIFPSLGGKPIRLITVPRVLEALRAIEARGAVETARRVRQRMSAVFMHAVASGLMETDPASVVRPALAPLIRSHQPAITDLDGIRAVLAAAEAIPAHPSTRLGLRLLALTAVRASELRGATLGEFEGLDGPEPLWRVPAERMKARREHVVPLAPAAVVVVRLARTRFGRGPLLFPSSRHAHHPLSENAFGYLLNRAGYHGRHVPHGFRAAFSSIMNDRRPADRAVIDLMLAHAPKDKVEAAYNRALHTERRRELAGEWAELLLKDARDMTELLATPRR